MAKEAASQRARGDVPRATAAHEIPPDQGRPGEERSMNIRVLILADHPMIRLGVRAALTAAPDVEVVGETSDGRGVVPWARKLGPDLFLIEFRPPPGSTPRPSEVSSPTSTSGAA